MTLTRFEITRILGTRAMQISHGALSTIDIVNLDNSLDIATEEYKQGKIPFIIIRTFPDGTEIEIDPNTGREYQQKKSSV